MSEGGFVMPGITHDEYLQRLYKKQGNKFTLLSRYTKSTDMIMVRCNDCGLETEKEASKLLYRGGCRGCSAKRNIKTHEKFIEQVRNKHGNNITILSKYINDKSKVLIRHNQCGATNWVTASSVIQKGIHCKSCQNDRLRNRFVKTHDEFIKEVYAKHGNNYTVLGKYYNAQTKILIRHNLCGYEWEVKPIYVLLTLSSCPRCCVKARRSKNPGLRKAYRNIRIRIIHMLQGRTKSKPTLKLLGLNSIEELRQHIELMFEDGMNWGNYGKKDGWQIDHIRPCASFDLDNKNEQYKCFHYTNLQPLWASDNNKKSSWWNGNRYRGGVIYEASS